MSKRARRCHRRWRLSGLERSDSRRSESFGEPRLGIHRRSWWLRGFAGTTANDPARLPDTQRIIARGGTILGTASRGRFSAKVGHGESRALPKELLEGVRNGMDALDLFALVCIGGDGTLSIAQQMFEHGIPVVGVPKTIDNDLEGTLFTFGFDSAVSCATDALDRLHTTAESHNRIIVLEVMGRYAGWIALYAGVAGGADVILIPEIPFSLRKRLRKNPGTREPREKVHNHHRC